MNEAPLPPTSARQAGRWVGSMLILHLTGGLILPYVLLARALEPPGFLENAAPHAGHLRSAVFLFLFSAAIVLGISVAAYPVLRRYTRRLAYCLMALAIANIPLQTIESASVLSMLSLSHQSGGAGADRAILETVATALGSARAWVHYLQLMTIVSWIAVLFASLWSAGVIPRLVAAAGLMTSGLQLVGVPMRALLGYSVVPELAMPLAPAYVCLAVWVFVKGLDVRRESL